MSLLTNAIKFLDSYEKKDRPIYFGRDKEIAALYQKAKESRIIVLYGLSGTGKTSLVQCGLANEFSDSDWLEITIRRGGYKSIIDAIGDKLKSLSKNIEYVGPVLLEPLRLVYLENLKPIYLIFDQFEELFIAADEKEIKKTVSFIRDILHDGTLPVTIIFSLREEYFAHLDNFEKKIPTIYDNKLRLERMSRRTLEDVITNISKKSDVILEPTVAEEIINAIENKKTKNVDLPYLQVYLKKLYSGLDPNNRKITANYVKTTTLQDVLSGFLEEQVQEISKNEKLDDQAIWSVLKNMITYEGTKKTVSLEQLENDVRGEMQKETVHLIIKKLQSAQVIQPQNEFFELKHDSLAAKIQTKRSGDENSAIEALSMLSKVKSAGGELTEDQINKIRPHLWNIRDIVDNDDEFRDLNKFLYTNESNISARKRKAARLQILIKGLIVLLVAVLLIIIFMVWNGQKEDYDRLVKGAREASRKDDFGTADGLYNEALNKPSWVKSNKTNIIKERQSVAARARNHEIGDSLFARGQIYFDDEKTIDSAYIKFQEALNYKQDPVFNVKLASARDRLRQDSISLENAIKGFEKAKGLTKSRIAEFYSKEYSEKLSHLKQLLNKDK